LRALFEFIAKFHLIILFLIIEVVCFVFIVQFNKPHNVKYLTSANKVTGTVYEGVNIVTKYFNLSAVNKELSEENAEIRNLYTRIDNPLILNADTVNDKQYKQQYSYTSAEVINNTVIFPKNYITISKGSDAGIQPDMAVIGPKGVVGVVFSTSKHYAVIMSVLNLDFRLSAQFKKNHYFGSLVWEVGNSRIAKLHEIPYHVDVKKGDTIITNAFSNIFPSGIPIGVVTGFKKSGGENFYDIDVTLSTDFKNVQQVYIVRNMMKSERDSIENLIHSGK
jgi:rod shape-determining protein MreC